LAAAAVVAWVEAAAIRTGAPAPVRSVAMAVAALADSDARVAACPVGQVDREDTAAVVAAVDAELASGSEAQGVQAESAVAEEEEDLESQPAPRALPASAVAQAARGPQLTAAVAVRDLALPSLIEAESST
jgi:hypothetical protein